RQIRRCPGWFPAKGIGPMADERDIGGLAITFLGTATSVGGPLVGCDCVVCHSEDARGKRRRSSLGARAREPQWAGHAGPDLRAQCLRAGIRELDAVLLTHAHTDHVAGFDDLRRFSAPEDARLPVYASTECLATVRRMFEFAFDGRNRFVGYLKPDPR